jgi:hypothetical protein
MPSGELLVPDGTGRDLGANYSKAFVEQVDKAADGVAWSSDYINEVFMHFYLRVLEIASLFKASDSERIVLNSYKGEWPVVVAAAKKEDLRIGFLDLAYFYLSGALLHIVSFFAVVLSVLVLPGLALVTRKRRPVEVASEFSVIRSPAAFDKMRFLSDSGKVEFYYDDLLQKETTAASLYGFGTLSERMLSLLIVPILAFRDYFRVANDSRRLLGWGGSGFVLYYFSKRIAHKCTFEYYLRLLIKRSGVDTYYTGNKEDRFAILEKRLCKEYAVSSVCVPHGIEYAFKTPAGLVGDVFYCTTEHARQHLSNLYAGVQAFVYDEVVARQMFSRHQVVVPAQGIVFFPESRGVDVNLLILGHLLGLGYDIAVKLHPKDDVGNYNQYAGQVTFISDLDSSISNKICLARKSTVLVETIYNNSTPIAILTDPRDRGYVEHMLPSLTDDQIKRVYSFEELACVLDKLRASA